MKRNTYHIMSDVPLYFTKPFALLWVQCLYMFQSYSIHGAPLGIISPTVSSPVFLAAESGDLRFSEGAISSVNPLFWQPKVIDRQVEQPGNMMNYGVNIIKQHPGSTRFYIFLGARYDIEPPPMVPVLYRMWRKIPVDLPW